MDVCLRNYGFCNYLSDKHCSIFFDEVRHCRFVCWVFFLPRLNSNFLLYAQSCFSSLPVCKENLYNESILFLEYILVTFVTKTKFFWFCLFLFIFTKIISKFILVVEIIGELLFLKLFFHIVYVFLYPLKTCVRQRNSTSF